MLSRFSVTNYMGFPEKITWDLSKPHDYAFNSNLIHNGIVKNGIIYGVNGSGKTSLGKAVFDIVSLVNNVNPVDYGRVIYQGAPNDPIDFEYSFVFDGGKKVDYSYSKNSQGLIIKESLLYQGQKIFTKDINEVYFCNEFSVNPIMRKKLAENANAVSILKFIFSSYPLSKNHYIQLLMDFIGSMLWFRCLDERNYIGIDTSRVYIEDYIIKHGYLDEFAKFLKEESGQEFDFTPTQDEDKVITCKIGNNAVPFLSVISTGTMSLELLFYWTKRMKEASVKFVFIDEFDAFYHFDLSINVCKTLFKEDFQVFMSSHNTMLLSNDFIRPDCGFIISNNKIDAISNLTSRGELRQGHNIEKMYRAGSFDI